MELYALPALALPFIVQDVLIVVGATVALLASLVFINLGILLPGLLTSLGGPQPDQRGAYLEFGPAAGPIISEPAPPRAALPEKDVEPRHVARPHLWSLTPGGRSHI
jgi:hypothetical protein